MRRLIITADDFGLCTEVNQAVERAHKEGVLTASSVIVSGDGFEEAAEIARRNPKLGVGLHLVLVEGRSVLPPEEIPDLVDRQGRFRNNLLAAGWTCFFARGIRDQIRRECEAQMRKFETIGVTCDHLNAHNHFHLHPTVGKIAVELCRRYEIPAVRVPCGPFFGPLTWLLKKRLRMNGILYNDAIFGLRESGRFDEAAWLQALDRLPQEGVTEIYTHPALTTGPILRATMPDYRHSEELAALLSPGVRRKIESLQIETTSYQFLS